MPKIFISYSRRDDKPFGPRALQWVETFEGALSETLGQRVGPGKVELWRDKRDMDETTLFDDTIERALDSSDLLITVLSQNYLVSDYCRRELRRFGEPRLQRGELRVGSHSRIVKVYRAVVDRAALRDFAAPPELASEVDGTEGFQIFCTEGDDYRDALLHPAGMEMVWQKADDLSRAIKRIIDESAQAAAARPPALRPVVYLAHTAGDMREVRAALRRELEDHGCTVLPSREPPEDFKDYLAAVRQDLDGACLSVHLLGRRYGAIAEGADESAVEAQLKLALDVQRPGFHTLVWSPLASGAATAIPGVAPAGADAAAAQAAPEPKMQALRERMAELSLPRTRMEYMRSGASPLGVAVRERLAGPVAVSAPPAPAAGTRRPLIYLLCDKADREDTRALKTSLEQLGFDVTRPPLEGTTQERDEDHQRCLVGCDAVVVVWGKVREPWVRKKLSDVQQAVGWGRQAPVRACIVLMGPPTTQAKSGFEAPPGAAVLPAADLPAALRHLLD